MPRRINLPKAGLIRFIITASLLLGQTRLLLAAVSDAFSLFEEEAQVITASRISTSKTQSPATVYILTSQDIRASGAQTLWDALRAVPGVDVLASRTSYGEVSIRGLNKALQSRTLVLLDGKTVLNGFFDFVNWEGIPIFLEEIDRIEVVEGPVSSLYGANGINGVINIITKTPEQLKGGHARYSVGERDTYLASALYGDKKGRWGYKMGTGWKSTNRFEDGGKPASQVVKLHGLGSYDLAENSHLSLSGGLTKLNTQVSVGSVGTGFEEGITSYARADYRRADTKLRTFWNRGRTRLREFNALSEPNLDYDTLDVNIEQGFLLPYSNNLVLGGGYRNNAMRSKVFQHAHVRQDLWALFMDHQWKPFNPWTFWVSGRLDKHPFTDWLFSPRASVLFSPLPHQVFRLSVGSAFRYPTLTENFLNFSQISPNPGTSAPNPPFTSLQLIALGNRNLSAEKIKMAELAYNGQLGAMKTFVTGFYYELTDIIAASPTQTLSALPPTLTVQTSFINQGKIVARGSECGVEIPLQRRIKAFTNYSYQFLKGSMPSADSLARTAPKHKVNGGLRIHSNGFTGNLWAHWVDQTFWSNNQRVADYVLLNAYAGYAFAGRFNGLELAVSAFNLANHRHFEILPAQSAAQQGQSGEIIGSRWTVAVSYKF